MPRTGLGKGLDSMIPNKNKSKQKKTDTSNDFKKEDHVSNHILSENVNLENMIDIQKIEPNRTQPRRKFDEDSIIELSDSIKQYGVLQPLLVQKKDDYYEIIAGERRWRAAKKAGLKELPVIIKDYSEEEVVQISLIENIQREDLNPIEEALAYKRLLEEYHLKQDEVAEKISKSRTAVTNSIRLLKLDERIQNMVIDDMISAGHARALLSITDKDLQYEIATKIFDEKLSVREAEKLVKLYLKNSSEKKEEKKDTAQTAIFNDFEKNLESRLGSKVHINHKKNNKGKIEIEYSSNDDFERLYEIIMKI